MLAWWHGTTILPIVDMKSLVLSEGIFLTGLAICTIWSLGIVNLGTIIVGITVLFLSTFFVMPVAGLTGWRQFIIAFFLSYFFLFIDVALRLGAMFSGGFAFGSFLLLQMLAFLPWFALMALIGFAFGKGTFRPSQSINRIFG